MKSAALWTDSRYFLAAEEQLEGFDLQLLKKILPKTILRIKKVLHGLSSDQEVGLFMHITC